MKSFIVLITLVVAFSNQSMAQEDGGKKWYDINNKKSGQSTSFNNKSIDKCFSEDILQMLESRLYLCYGDNSQSRSIRNRVKSDARVSLGVNINSFIFTPSELMNKDDTDIKESKKMSKLNLFCEKYDSIPVVQTISFTRNNGSNYLVSDKKVEASSIQLEQNVIIKDKDYITATISDTSEFTIKYGTINLSKMDINSKMENIENGLIFELISENGMLTFKLLGYMSKQKGMIILNADEKHSAKSNKKDKK